MRTLCYHPEDLPIVDPLTAARRQAAFWRACTIGSLLAALAVAAVRHPAAVVILICTIALLTLFCGGILLSAHRSDPEMGIAPREDGLN
ncbi:MAG: hypothetical protein U1G08_18025 [Verrucomicrobiota bacterium]